MNKTPGDGEAAVEFRTGKLGIILEPTMGTPTSISRTPSRVLFPTNCPLAGISPISTTTRSPTRSPEDGGFRVRLLIRAEIRSQSSIRKTTATHNAATDALGIPILSEIRSPAFLPGTTSIPPHSAWRLQEHLATKAGISCGDQA